MGCPIKNNRILKTILWFVLVLFSSGQMQAQSLLGLLDEDEVEQKEIVRGTFKATRLVNGHTIETLGEKQFLFLITHRFESIDEGFRDLFGLDNSIIRFGFEYGINDRLNAGIGRSNYHKLYDGYLKYKLIQQSTGFGSVPFSITLLSSMSVNTEEWIDDTKAFETAHRINYVYQALIASKINSKISLQMVPSIVHKNLVNTRDENNTIGVLGMGGRYKITNRFTCNIEYYWLFPNQIANIYTNMLSLGFDIETGGHVFQLIFSNSRGVTEKTMLTETTGKWAATDIHFGFNVSRFFSFDNKDK